MELAWVFAGCRSIGLVFVFVVTFALWCDNAAAATISSRYGDSNNETVGSMEYNGSFALTANQSSSQASNGRISFGPISHAGYSFKGSYDPEVGLVKGTSRDLIEHTAEVEFPGPQFIDAQVPVGTRLVAYDGARSERKIVFSWLSVPHPPRWTWRHSRSAIATFVNMVPPRPYDRHPVAVTISENDVSMLQTSVAQSEGKYAWIGNELYIQWMGIMYTARRLPRSDTMATLQALSDQVRAKGAASSPVKQGEQFAAAAAATSNTGSVQIVLNFQPEKGKGWPVLTHGNVLDLLKVMASHLLAHNLMMEMDGALYAVTSAGREVRVADLYIRERGYVRPDVGNSGPVPQDQISNITAFEVS